MKRLGRIWTVIVYLFLYAPMFILFIGSFNDGKDLSEFEGFTLGNYADLFRNSHLVGLLGNSVLLALCSAVLATLLGTLAALGIKAMRGRLRRLVMSLTNIPLVNPEIVTGVSLALLFVFIGRRMLSTENVFGFATLLIAHVTFCLPYVILSVMPKLHQLDPSLMDAAQDLGCTPLKGFFKVVLPELTPGIVSGAIMAFTLLNRWNVDPLDTAVIVSAIGQHDERNGTAVDPVSAALILADKTDVRRNRVRNQVKETFDKHDRVNYAALSSKLIINAEDKTAKLKIVLDENISSIMDYFEIFMQRMLMCKRASELLGLNFKLIANGRKIC